MPVAARTRCSSGSCDELRWLGLDWDEGPGVGGPHGPYRQSERGGSLRGMRWRASRPRARPIRASARPRNCSFRARRSSSAGRPPRYARTCAGARAGGSPASNRGGAAARDPLSRARSPRRRVRRPHPRAAAVPVRRHRRLRHPAHRRQRVVLPRQRDRRFGHGHHAGAARRRSPGEHAAPAAAARGARPAAKPEYGHLPLVLAPNGTPLSKRDGAASLTRPARAGLPAGGDRQLPAAARAFAAGTTAGWRWTSWPRTSISRAPAIPPRASTRRSCGTGSAKPSCTRPTPRSSSGSAITSTRCPRASSAAAFVAVVKGNVLLPADVDELVAVVTADVVPFSDEAAAQIREAGAEFFVSAAGVATARARISRPGRAPSPRPRAARARSCSCRCAPR